MQQAYSIFKLVKEVRLDDVVLYFSIRLLLLCMFYPVKSLKLSIPLSKGKIIISLRKLIMFDPNF